MSQEVPLEINHGELSHDLSVGIEVLALCIRALEFRAGSVVSYATKVDPLTLYRASFCFSALCRAKVFGDSSVATPTRVLREKRGVRP